MRRLAAGQGGTMDNGHLHFCQAFENVALFGSVSKVQKTPIITNGQE